MNHLEQASTARVKFLSQGNNGSLRWVLNCIGLLTSNLQMTSFELQLYNGDIRRLLLNILIRVFKRARISARLFRIYRFVYETGVLAF